MLKPQPQGQVGDGPVVVEEFYRITVTHVQFIEMDVKDFSQTAPYPLIRGIEEVKSAEKEPIYQSEQLERPTFTKL